MYYLVAYVNVKPRSNPWSSPLSFSLICGVVHGACQTKIITWCISASFIYVDANGNTF